MEVSIISFEGIFFGDQSIERDSDSIEDHEWERHDQDTYFGSSQECEVCQRKSEDTCPDISDDTEWFVFDDGIDQSDDSETEGYDLGDLELNKYLRWESLITGDDDSTDHCKERCCSDSSDSTGLCPYSIKSIDRVRTETKSHDATDYPDSWSYRQISSVSYTHFGDTHISIDDDRTEESQLYQ